MTVQLHIRQNLGHGVLFFMLAFLENKKPEHLSNISKQPPELHFGTKDLYLHLLHLDFIESFKEICAVLPRMFFDQEFCGVFCPFRNTHVVDDGLKAIPVRFFEISPQKLVEITAIILAFFTVIFKRSFREQAIFVHERKYLFFGEALHNDEE